MQKRPHLQASFVMQGKATNNIYADFIVINDFNVAPITSWACDDFIQYAYTRYFAEMPCMFVDGNSLCTLFQQEGACETLD